jgi:acetyl-CoA synthetase
MVERFLQQTTFRSQEDYRKNLHIRVPENFNFAYDVVDAYAEEQPDRKALLWTNDQGAEIQFTFADMKRETDRTASYFQSLGIGKGDVVMLILKRRYEFWFSILALHKLGAVVIPATHLLTKKDVVYRCNTAGIKAIVAADKRRAGNSRRIPRFPRGNRKRRPFRASAAGERQRRYHDDVLHIGDHGRT